MVTTIAHIDCFSFHQYTVNLLDTVGKTPTTPVADKDCVTMTTCNKDADKGNEPSPEETRYLFGQGLLLENCC